MPSCFRSFLLFFLMFLVFVVPAHVWCLLLFSLLLLAGFCFLLFAFLFAFCFPRSTFAVFASCFLLSIASAFCLWLSASCFLLSVSCFCFLLFVFCFVLSVFAFCFYVFWTEKRHGCNKNITMTLTKDSHYSNLYSIFVVTNTSTGAIITSNFPVTNERTSRNNKRFPCYTTIIISITHRYF